MVLSLGRAGERPALVSSRWEFLPELDDVTTRDEGKVGAGEQNFVGDESTNREPVR